MPGFLTSNVHLTKEIEESCKWFDNIYERYEQMAGAIDNLTDLKKDVLRAASKVDELSSKNENDKEQLRNFEKTAQAMLAKFDASLKTARDKLYALPDFSAVTDEIHAPVKEIYEDIKQLNNSVVEFNLAKDITVDAVQLYKSTKPDMRNKEFRTLTLESTADKPLEILVSTESGYYSAGCRTSPEVYKHSIRNVTKGGTEFRIPSRGEEHGPFKSFNFRAEIIAINGRYLKELNRDEVKVVLGKEIATGKAVLDVVKETNKYPEMPYMFGNKGKSNNSTISEQTKTTTVLTKSTEVEHKPTAAPAPQKSVGSQFSWIDVLAIIVVAVITVIISIIMF